jgi:RNA polymerase sigma-70 factor (ECF subfamily)
MTTQVEEQAMTQSTSHARGGAGTPGSQPGAPSGSSPDAAVPTWDEVVELHSARVYRLAYRLTGNRQDAEDLTQEVFVRVFRSLSSYTPGTFAGWLHRITTNLFLDGARRKAKIRFDALADDADARIPSRTVTPDAAVLEGLFDDDVENALRALPPDFRAAVVLCDIEGLSYEEIADVLDLKLGTVRSRIHRGRSMLRRALAHRAPAEGRSRYSGPADQQPSARRGRGLTVQPT